jgi:hypothetical protein
MQGWYGRIIGSVLVGGLLLAGYSVRSEAGELLDKVKVTVDEVLATLSNKTLQPQERRTKVRQAVSPTLWLRRDGTALSGSTLALAHPPATPRVHSTIHRSARGFLHESPREL